MSKTFTLDSVTQLGDVDPKYGATFWCETREQLEPVMFNSMATDIGPGAVITAEEVLLKQSKKGKDYHRLKKVKIMDHGEGEPSGTSSSSAPQAGGDMAELLRLVREIHAIMTDKSAKQAVNDSLDNYSLDDDLQNIPF